MQGNIRNMFYVLYVPVQKRGTFTQQHTIIMANNYGDPEIVETPIWSESNMERSWSGCDAWA